MLRRAISSRMKVDPFSALAKAMLRVRIVAPIPGKGTIGIDRDPDTGLYLFPDTPDTLDDLRRLRAGSLDSLQITQPVGS